MCKAALEPVDFLLENATVRKGLDWIALQVCLKEKIEGGKKSVCEGAIDIMASNLLPAIAKGVLSPQRVCDEYLHLCSSPEITELSADAYVEMRLNEKPASLKNNDFVDNLYAKIAADPNPRPTKRSIQLSDPHIDFYYLEGAPSQCDYPICCRDNGPDMTTLPGSTPAGKWGDFNCDIPQITLENMWKFIGENQDSLKTDFITWVGDNSAHNVWDNTNEEVT
jgi:hypothetical protein